MIISENVLFAFLLTGGKVFIIEIVDRSRSKPENIEKRGMCGRNLQSEDISAERMA
jgi:hypothetical protein